jgi:transglutaminase-like putative cysteine protease
MLGVVALSVADARPLEIDGLPTTGPLILTTVLAGVVGYCLARSRLGLVRAHTIGAAVGAVSLLVVCDTALRQGDPPALDVPAITEAAGALAARLTAELERFLGPGQVPPVTLTLFLLGALLWTTGQSSAFAVFRQQRAAPAVAATGGLLILNEALPATESAPDQIPMLLLLAVWSVLALLLVVRLQLLAQRRHWARRHIDDSGEVSRLFLRSGSIFAAITVVAATSLAAVATVPAQQVDTRILGPQLEGLRNELARWLSVVAVELPGDPNAGMDDRLPVPDTWQQGEGTAFEAVLAGGLRGNYWWGSAFADFDGHEWIRDDTTTEDVAADELVPIPPDVTGAGPYEIAATITPRTSRLTQSVVLGASEVAFVDRPTRVRSLGDAEGLAEIVFSDRLSREESYAVTSFSHDYRPRRGSLTASQLRAAGTDYPTWIGRYLEVRDGASGERTRDLADRAAARAAAGGSATPFDIASELQGILRGFEYSTDVSGQCREGENVPECLLSTRAGFCLHFASTMVMALRENDVPARVVNGYLPGLEEGEGRYRVPLAALHAWVEVYFPDVGWVRFDPTPGGQLGRFEQEATELAEGDPLASPDAFDSFPPESALPSEESFEEPSPSALVPPAGGNDEGAMPDLTAIVLGSFGLAAVLFAFVGVLLAVRLRRLPGPDGSLAFRRVAALAGRSGHGPSDTQTEYEYVASLSETLPSIREELYVVARSSVEQRYGRRPPEGTSWTGLRAAYARVRTALLRLMLRSWR